MKKILVSLAIGSVLLSGCDDKPIINEVPADEGRFNGINTEYINIITDLETGCKYIFIDDGQGNYRVTAMSPLYKSSGVIACD